MGESWGGFTPLLWCWSAPLALFALDRLCSCHAQARCLRSVLPPLLLLGGLWLQPQLGGLAQRCQAALDAAPLQFFDLALRLPPG